MEARRLVFGATRDVLDAAFGHGREDLGANRRAQIGERLVAIGRDDDTRAGCGPRDGVADVAADFEATRPYAGADRGDEPPPVETAESALDDPGDDAAPARMNRRHVAARFVGHENGHAIGDANADRQGTFRRSRHDRVGFRAGAGHSGPKNGLRAVHLFDLHDPIGGDGGHELRVADADFREGMGEAGLLQEGRKKEGHARDDASAWTALGTPTRRRLGPFPDSVCRATPMRPQDPFIGREILNGQFQILQKVGSGGMGAVYKALQSEMNRMVGVKILHPKLANRKDLVSRFRREARAMSQLTHPNTAKVFLYGEFDDGPLYIVMEFLEGKNLNQTLRSDGPFSMERALPILVQASGALE